MPKKEGTLKAVKYQATEIIIGPNENKEESLDIIMRTIVRKINGSPEQEIEIKITKNVSQLKELVKEIEFEIQKLENKNNKNIFILNNFLKLVLESDGRTRIYVNNAPFRVCTFLLLQIPTDKVEKYDEIKSIDEAELYLGKDLDAMGAEQKAEEFKLSTEEEFRGHCSNMQAWVENEYNTTILHRNLAFPLLKELTKLGDPVAKRVYKEELGYRLSSNDIVITQYLLKEKYLKDLSEDELQAILDNSKPGITKMMLQNYFASTFKGFHSTFDEKKMALVLNQDVLITSNEKSALKYDDYKKPFNLLEIKRFSRYMHNKSFIYFGVDWEKFNLLYKTEHIELAKSFFSNKEAIMVHIPRSKAPLKLVVVEENLVVYINPELMFKR